MRWMHPPSRVWDTRTGTNGLYMHDRIPPLLCHSKRLLRSNVLEVVVSCALEYNTKALYGFEQWNIMPRLVKRTQIIGT